MLAHVEYLLSRNGYYKFIHQKDDNLEILCNGDKIWESHTKGKSTDRFYIAKGGLALYDTDKKVIWQTGPWRGDTNPETVIMQNDGNFVMYDKNGNAIWELGTRGRCPKGMYFSSRRRKILAFMKKWLVGRIDYSQLYFLFKTFEMPVFSIKTLEAHQRHN